LLNIGKGLEIVVVLAFNLYGCFYNPDQFHFFHTLPTTPLPPHHTQKYKVYKKIIKIKNK
jgi:hypothetical protein